MVLKGRRLESGLCLRGLWGSRGYGGGGYSQEARERWNGYED